MAGVYTETIALPPGTDTAHTDQEGLIMANGIDPAQQDTSRPQGRPSPGAETGGQMQNLGWIPVALGAAAIVAGLGGRKKGAAALALTAFAGAGALGSMRSAQAERAKGSGKPEAERSITIGKSADELRQYWLDPKTLPQVMAGFATVTAAGEGRMHWKLEGPFGRTWEWDTETVDRPGEGIGWRSMSERGTKNEGWLRFDAAPAGRGTVLTLHLRFDPPAGGLGGEALELLGSTPLKLAAEAVLRRFKNLVETGEIPTTMRQPAARADTQ
ncbi:SRPBCC family protein [Massilia sp. IC2-477]|uniref:SRPBCC family protein n=1 Tax=Massilia sp. IC2-477 TaxID=2887198 RepID=UPI001D10FE64|nr:SRPBCC family protein [Massilia sp. IC2-477]MCC2955607.1 SRPBCC family protein [Massilia sp. IC2-477]